MNPSNSMRVALSKALSRSSSQRAERGKIGAIRRERVGREAALHPHCVQEPLQGRIRHVSASRVTGARGACINCPFQSRRHKFPRGNRTKCAVRVMVCSMRGVLAGRREQPHSIYSVLT